MDFGHLDDLSNVDFTLPPDGFDPKALWGGKPAKHPRVDIASPAWSIKEWVGKVYPPKTPATRYLQEYGKQYTAVELNATRYSIPGIAQTESWASQVPDGFLFCPKFPETITHFKQLKDCEKPTDEFLHGLAGFGEKLGTAFLLVSPSLSTNQAPKLYNYLRLLEGRISYMLELRHASWYEDKTALEELRAYLISQKQGLVITDVPGRRDVLHMAPTNGEVFIRWVGQGLVPTDYTRMDAWAERLAYWLSHGLERVSFFIHEPNKVLCPEADNYMIQRMNALTNLKLKEATFYSLF